MTPARMLATALAALVAGCATTPALRTVLPADQPGSHELTATPFFPQQEFQCGPAALATVLRAAGVEADPAALAPQVFLPGRQGSLQAELIAATRRHERLPYVLPERPQALLAELQAGRPVLVLQNLGVRSYPLWHYAVLVGYDAGRNDVVLRSGAEPRRSMGWSRFLGSWERGGRWAIVALRPGELPASAEPRRYLEAAAGLESTGHGTAAAAAYAAAAERWPLEPLAWLGLGNVRYGEREFIAAADAYRHAVEFDPAHAAARNNLAQALVDAGCPSLARAQAARAVELAGEGPYKVAAAATLAAIAGSSGTGAEPTHCSRLAQAPTE